MIRFYNGLLLENGVVTDHELWTDGAVISYVGPETAERPVFEREVDLQGNLLMPGFKNAHTHSGMTFLRSLADDEPLDRWLNEMIFPREARLTPEALESFVKVAFLEYLANGITACFDMYFFIDRLAALSARWGFRTVICDSLMFDENPAVLYERYEKFNHYHPLVSYQLGFHAEYTSDEKLLSKVAEAAHYFKAPVFSHNSETRSETANCVQKRGLTPTAYFESLGLFDYGGGGFHCVHFTPEDMDIFVKHGLYVVLNACSNAKLASGIAPLRAFEQKGVRLAVGTDGPASNNALDFFREMYLINVLAKLREQDAAAGNPALILDAAVRGGALALGLTDCDCLAVGKQADMIVIDMSRPNMRPVNNVVKNLIYSGSNANVRMTMIAGRVLYEDGRFFVGEDPADIYREAERCTAAILAADNK